MEDNPKQNEKGKGGARKEPVGKVVTNANDLQSFGNLNRLRNIDKNKKVETDLLSKTSKSSPSLVFSFPNYYLVLLLFIIFLGPSV